MRFTAFAWFLLGIFGGLLGPRDLFRDRFGLCNLQETKRHFAENGTNSKLPSCIIQIGPTHSAATLQFQQLCVAMYLARPDSIVRCEIEKAPSVIKSNEFWIMKTHDPKWARQVVEQCVETWVFMTAEDSNPLDRTELAIGSATVKSVCDVRTCLETDGAGSMSARYGHMLHLSASELRELQIYMRYWELLQKCCGSEMSPDWRGFLKFGYSYAPARRSETHPLAHECSIYDLGRAERLLMETSVVRRFGQSAEQLLRPDTETEHRFTGHFCVGALVGSSLV